MVQPIGGTPWTSGPSTQNATWSTTSFDTKEEVLLEEVNDNDGIYLKLGFGPWKVVLILNVWKEEADDS